MPGAPFSFDVRISTDDDMAFVIIWKQEDGSEFPWDDYAVTYVAKSDCGCCYRCDYGWPSGASTQNLSEGAGITVEASENEITFDLSTATKAGIYAHSCRVTEIATGKRELIFDGKLTILQGVFS